MRSDTLIAKICTTARLVASHSDRAAREWGRPIWRTGAPWEVVVYYTIYLVWLYLHGALAALLIVWAGASWIWRRLPRLLGWGPKPMTEGPSEEVHRETQH